MRLRISFVAGLVALGTIIGTAPSAQADPKAPAQAVAKQEGVTFTGWWNDAYDGQGPVDAMTGLAGTGAGWVSIMSVWYQPTYRSRYIRPTEGTTTDAGVVHMIQTAHAQGLSVMLKPHVDLWDDPDHWRGEIGTAWAGKPKIWARWFQSYRHFIFHYAELAEANGVEQFAVGTELVGTIGKQAQWRRIIAGVRDRFTGTLTYASTVGGEEHRILWWDALDFIGVDAYYDLTNENDPTVQELEDAWTPWIQELADLSAAWGDQPIIFTEVGFRSIDGANQHPWDWYTQGTVDLQEQADCYEATFAAVWDEPWLAGMFWWDWRSDGGGGAQDRDYTPFGKPAEAILSSWY